MRAEQTKKLNFSDRFGRYEYANVVFPIMCAGSEINSKSLEFRIIRINLIRHQQ